MTPVSATPDTHERRTTVLLVEDELLLRWPAGEYLRDAGYRVVEAPRESPPAGADAPDVGRSRRARPRRAGREAPDAKRAILAKPYDLSAAAERIRQMLSHR
jgi:hypothetical protein